MLVTPLVGKQRASVQLATARVNIWEGAVRSSKTVSSILKWLQYVREGPQGPLLMTGKTERTLKRNIIDPIQAMVGKNRCKYRAGAGELDLFGRLIYTAGANDERSAEKIKGMTLAGAYCDEITTYPESFYDMLGTRLSVADAQLFATTNPESKNHWLMRNYLRRASLHLDKDGRVHRMAGDDRLDLARFSFTLDDNPNLDRAYVEDLKRKYVGLFYKRYILGDWVLAEGAIYDMFDEDLHVVDIMPAITRWIALGIDYGTSNPFHAGLLGLGTDGRLYVPADWRYDSTTARRSLTDHEYSERLRGWLARVPHPGSTAVGVWPEWTVVDPSAASFVQQLYRDGLTPTLADNSVLDGIRLVSSLFATDRLKIHRSCTSLVDELTGYAWDPKATEKGEDKPLKIDDHGPDALRYAAITTQAVWQGQLMEAAA
jgi:PBSX family phage terminase large subunit